jgi:hypothetical protein
MEDLMVANLDPLHHFCFGSRKCQENLGTKWGHVIGQITGRDVTSMGVWQGVAMGFLIFHLGLPCPTLALPVGGPPLKRP